MGFLSKLAEAVHADPITQVVSKIDPLAGAVDKTALEAVETGWGKPLGTDKSGLDVLGAGPLNQFGIGGDPNKPQDRAVGRSVGTIFAGYGAGVAGVGNYVKAATSIASIVSSADAAKKKVPSPRSRLERRREAQRLSASVAA